MSIEAMKMALEALEEAEAGHAAQILREALAESKPKYTTTRNAWTGKATHKCSVCGRDDFRSEHAAAFHKCQAIEQAEPDYEALYAQMCERCDILGKQLAVFEQAQKQEPVAITITGKLGNIYSFTGDYSLKKGDKVYTSPPPRQPLTDEEIKKAAPTYAVDDFLDFNAGVRFAEAAHGIKENT